jgi:hypothetical protein
MDSGVAALLGALIGGMASFGGFIIQLKVARVNADKDVTLQRDRLNDARIMGEVAEQRKMLQELHVTLSRISMEHSQTTAYIQASDELDVTEFRKQYRVHCEIMHRALAIADMYYPEMGERMRKIYGCMNIYWGHQDQMLKAQREGKPRGSRDLQEVIAAGKEINEEAFELQCTISKYVGEIFETTADAFHKDGPRAS